MTRFEQDAYRQLLVNPSIEHYEQYVSGEWIQGGAPLYMRSLTLTLTNETVINFW